MIEDQYCYVQVVFFVVDFFDYVIEVVEWVVGNVDYFVWFEQYFGMWFFYVFMDLVEDSVCFVVMDWQWFVGCIVDEVYYFWGFFYQMLVFVIDVWFFVFGVCFDLYQNVIWEEFVFVVVFLVGVYFDYFFGWYQYFVEFFFYVGVFDVFVQ